MSSPPHKSSARPSPPLLPLARGAHPLYIHPLLAHTTVPLPSAPLPAHGAAGRPYLPAPRGAGASCGRAATHGACRRRTARGPRALASIERRSWLKLHFSASPSLASLNTISGNLLTRMFSVTLLVSGAVKLLLESGGVLEALPEQGLSSISLKRETNRSN